MTLLGTGTAAVAASPANKLNVVTVTIYHGKKGTAGFEGAATCHFVNFDKKLRLYKFHGCSHIVKPNQK